MNLPKEVQELQLRHAGYQPGLANTTRVNLWFEAEPIPAFIDFLTRQCDAQGVQGIETLVVSHADDQHHKVQLIISDIVDVSRAAAAWIGGVNQTVAEMPSMVIQRLRTPAQDDGWAHHSEDTFAWMNAND